MSLGPAPVPDPTGHRKAYVSLRTDNGVIGVHFGMSVETELMFEADEACQI